ncbi:HET-domain-containing protein [Lentinus tigrinus ALCF2SS1-7]|uniref:HET-domain-containing protein n=1 Tax=Lentinus tigrinus ALCF2SS1-7 TaxID=1328758 RepID=UPI0011663D85|nr:HET-domain-containing protein [Lentinus tigrinus ALCF2SS1-7]
MISSRAVPTVEYIRCSRSGQAIWWGRKGLRRLVPRATGCSLALRKTHISSGRPSYRHESLVGLNPPSTYRTTMWLLSTDRAELHYYVSPEEVPDGYAILSHVWDKKEHTFQEIKALSTRCEGTDTNPRDLLHPSDKIRRCCEVAASHGYRWVWIDTCCIDKTSSAELSEAINSMFRWYALAKICYAYLADVSSSELTSKTRNLHLHTRRSGSMGSSNWFRRGWTLQELLAPSFVVFLAADWGALGTKADYAELLEEVTAIPFQVLTLQRPIADFSVAQRMSWAANRQTTRVEDGAYCLMGIFGVTMPPLYGEGDMAFQRLQEEIMKHYDDSTLFAWSTKPFAIWTMQLRPVEEDSLAFGLGCDMQDHDSHPYLCAPNPSMEFYNIVMSFAAYQGTPLAETALRPTFTLTPYSARAHIPVIDMADLKCTLILMPWVDTDTNWNVGLLFGPCTSSSDPSRPLHCICVNRLAYWAIEDGQLACLGRKWPPSSSRIRWADVDLLHRLPVAARVDPRSTLRRPGLTLDTALRAPFRFSALDVWRYQHYNWLMMSSPSTLWRSDPEHPQWDGSPPALVAFSDNQGVRFTLRFGRCDAVAPPALLPDADADADANTDADARPTQQGALWADVLAGPGGDDANTRPHDCATDHIDRWTLRTKVFPYGDSEHKATWFLGYWKFRVAFTPCNLNPDTLVVHVVPRRHPDMPSMDSASYRALYDEVYLVHNLLYYWGVGDIRKAGEDVARTVEELKYDVEAMDPGAPYGGGEERLWLVQQTRVLWEKCCKILDDMKRDPEDGQNPVPSSPVSHGDS